MWLSLQNNNLGFRCNDDQMVLTRHFAFTYTCQSISEQVFLFIIFRNLRRRKLKLICFFLWIRSVVLKYRMQARNWIIYSSLKSYMYRVFHKKVYSSFLGKIWSKCLLKLTPFTQCNAQTLLYHMTKFYNYWTWLK